MYIVSQQNRIGAGRAAEANEFAYVVTEAAAEVFADDPPRFLARTPHGYHDSELIRGKLDKAGFYHVSITTR